MRHSLFRKLAIAILSMDLPEDKLQEVEQFLGDKAHVRRLLDACRDITRVVTAELDESSPDVDELKSAADADIRKLLNAVTARRDVTTRRLSGLVELVCRRRLRPGKSSKSEFVRKLGKMLSREEVDRLTQMVMEFPRLEESRGRDEWFHQMLRRIEGDR